MSDEPEIGPSGPGAGGVNPTWTAPVTPPPAAPTAPTMPSGAVTPTTAIGPPPLTEAVTAGGSPVPINRPAAPPVSPSGFVSPTPELSPAILPPSPELPAGSTVPPPAPSVESKQPLTEIIPPAELAITPPPPPAKHFPWRTFAISGGLLVVIGGAILYLWSEGIVLGAPRDVTKALAKMVAALEKAPAYHLEGQATLRFGPAEASATTAELDRWPDLLENFRASAEELAQEELAPCCDEPGIACSPTIDGADVCPQDTTAGSLPLPDEAVELNFSFEGDRADDKTSQMTLSFDLSGLLTLLPPTIPPAIDLDFRRVGGDIFLRLPILSLVVGSESNKWLAFAERDLQSVSQESYDWKSIDQAALAQAINSGQRVGYEPIGPIRTAHYRFSVDPLALIEALKLKQSLESVAESVKNVAIEADFWLGTRNSLPYQYVLTMTFLDQNLGVDSQLLIKTRLSDYGKAVSITAPNDEEVIRDGLDGLFSGDLTDFELKARDTERKSDLSELKTALELYKGDHGSYLSTGGAITRSNDATGPLQELVRKGYLSGLPVDPLDPTNWYGYQSADGTSYELWSIIEDENDPTAMPRGPYLIYRLQNDPPGGNPSQSTTSPSPLATPSVSPTGSSRLPGTS